MYDLMVAATWSQEFDLNGKGGSNCAESEEQELRED